MDQILDEPVIERRNLRYAGFWIRFVAYIIDGIILSFVSSITQFIIFEGDSPDANDIMLYYFFLVLAMVLVYFPGMESSKWQATLGKMAIGVKVGNPRGERISFLNALGRFASKFISLITLYIGFMMAGWTQKSQALHDIIADTVVFYNER